MLVSIINIFVIFMSLCNIQLINATPNEANLITPKSSASMNMLNWWRHMQMKRDWQNWQSRRQSRNLVDSLQYLSKLMKKYATSKGQDEINHHRLYQQESLVIIDSLHKHFHLYQRSLRSEKTEKSLLQIFQLLEDEEKKISLLKLLTSRQRRHNADLIIDELPRITKDNVKIKIVVLIPQNRRNKYSNEFLQSIAGMRDDHWKREGLKLISPTVQEQQFHRILQIILGIKEHEIRYETLQSLSQSVIDGNFETIIGNIDVLSDGEDSSKIDILSVFPQEIIDLHSLLVIEIIEKMREANQQLEGLSLMSTRVLDSNFDEIIDIIESFHDGHSIIELFDLFSPEIREENAELVLGVISDLRNGHLAWQALELLSQTVLDRNADLVIEIATEAPEYFTKILNLLSTQKLVEISRSNAAVPEELYQVIMDRAKNTQDLQLRNQLVQSLPIYYYVQSKLSSLFS